MTEKEEMDNAISEFELVREALIAFRQDNTKVLEKYEALVEGYNACLNKCKNVMRANHERLGKKYGEFHVSTRTDIDVNLLLELFPDAIAFTKTAYTLDKKMYAACVKTGAIPEDVVEAVEVDGPVHVYGPKAL